SRSSGITVVNQDGALRDPSAGRGLGLGLKTGSSTSGQKGPRISTNRNGPISSRGLHTAGGLARAMQERGTGVSDAFLLAPTLATSGANDRTGNPRRGRGVSVIGGRAASGGNTQASRHKEMVLGGRPGRKPVAVQQQITGKPIRPARGGASNKPVAASGGKGKGPAPTPAPGGKGGKPGKGKGKGGKPKPAPANASSLDNDLDEYMMKNEHTAASMLDNDLDSYMSEKLDDGTW
ncbi:hypothetical protein BGZ76_001063, partial [Entomortierella beljakovae]